MSRCRRMSRMGIVYSLSETGTGRLIFDDDRTAFEGVLETPSGETISLRGTVCDDTTAPSTSSGPVMMNVFIVDGEAGSSFRVEQVEVRMEHDHVTIQNSSINFTTSEKLIGNKADVEIQQFLRPNLAHDKSVLYVGPMKVQFLASQRPHTSRRTESICESKNDVRILEQSDDFLA